MPLTVVVDKVAASGGYMMACVADKILAAPFAVLGSIGVIAQLPNFNRLLKKNDTDFELLTAGEHNPTLTMFGENTDKGREKFVEELETGISNRQVGLIYERPPIRYPGRCKSKYGEKARLSGRVAGLAPGPLIQQDRTGREQG